MPFKFAKHFGLRSQGGSKDWEVKYFPDGQIQLKNVITKKFLSRLKKKGVIGTVVLKEKNRQSTIWTRQELSQSKQISLKSNKNDYLNSETDK